MQHVSFLTPNMLMGMQGMQPGIPMHLEMQGMQRIQTHESMQPWGPQYTIVSSDSESGDRKKSMKISCLCVLILTVT